METSSCFSPSSQIVSESVPNRFKSSKEISTILKTNLLIMKDDSYGQLFGCKLCGKSFTREYTLKMHLYSHFNIRRFECDICHKRFTLRQHLSEHVITHTNERPYVCPYEGCFARFRQRAKRCVHISAVHRCREPLRKKSTYRSSTKKVSHKEAIFRIHIQTEPNPLEKMAIVSDFPQFFIDKTLPIPANFDCQGVLSWQ